LRVFELAADTREATSSERRSLLVDEHADVELIQEEERHQLRGGLSRRKVRRGLAAAILMISRRRKTLHGGIQIMPVPSRPFGSGNGDHARPCSYPLSLAHQVLESSASPGKRGGSYSKQGSSTDARTVDGGYDRWLIAQLVRESNSGKSRGNGRGKFSAHRQERQLFSIWLSRTPFPPTCPRGDGGLRQRKSRPEERQRPWDGAFEMRRRDRRATTWEAFPLLSRAIFASLSPPISSKTEVTRDLD
jgi:hypothetical protein